MPVASLLAEPVGAQRTLAFDDLWVVPPEGSRLAAPLAGALRLDHTNRGVYAVGTFRTTLAAFCSRCLRDIELPVDVPIEEEILPSLDLLTGAPLGGADEPDVARLTDHHEIDLGRLLVEGLWLAEPIAPLCRSDCPGLCQICGLELAEGDHDHGEAAGDPRLAVLGGLRVDDDEETG